jgi:hypothetical protein
LDSDKGKHARILTEHTTSHRQLPSTNQRLRHLLEKRDQKELRKIHATAEDSAKRHAQLQTEKNKPVHEKVMVAHLPTKAKERAVVAGAIETEAKATP